MSVVLDHTAWHPYGHPTGPGVSAAADSLSLVGSRTVELDAVRPSLRTLFGSRSGRSPTSPEPAARTPPCLRDGRLLPGALRKDRSVDCSSSTALGHSGRR